MSDELLLYNTITWQEQVTFNEMMMMSAL